jgi:hypothetical protein
MPWEDPTQYADPLSLADAERQMRWVLRAMYEAKGALEDLRNDEVTIKHQYERARRKFALSDECPKVARGGATVADREVWIDERVAAERERYELAQAATQAAKDHANTLQSQAVVISSLSKLVQQIHGVVGAGR